MFQKEVSASWQKGRLTNLVNEWMKGQTEKRSQRKRPMAGGGGRGAGTVSFSPLSPYHKKIGS